MQVYTALLRRNAGQGGYVVRAERRRGAARRTAVPARETHHVYPVLVYFRFRESRHSMSPTALVALDAAALITAALDDEQFGWIKTSAALAQLEDSAFLLPQTLSEISPDGHGHASRMASRPNRFTDGSGASLGRSRTVRRRWRATLARATIQGSHSRRKAGACSPP